VRSIRQKEIEAVLSLDAQGRFKYFIKHVVDEEGAWGLWKDGWYLMADEHGLVLPLWPAREFAVLCRVGEWAEHDPREISLELLLHNVMPTLEQRGMRAGIFPTPSGRGVVVSTKELSSALEAELARYD
jgi:hypothetical protein